MKLSDIKPGDLFRVVWVRPGGNPEIIHRGQILTVARVVLQHVKFLESPFSARIKNGQLIVPGGSAIAVLERHSNPRLMHHINRAMRKATEHWIQHPSGKGFKSHKEHRRWCRQVVSGGWFDFLMKETVEIEKGMSYQDWVYDQVLIEMENWDA